MSYNNTDKTTDKNENTKRINLDEIIEDEFNLSKKKKTLNDNEVKDPEWKPAKKINVNEDV